MMKLSPLSPSPQLWICMGALHYLIRPLSVCCSWFSSPSSHAFPSSGLWWSLILEFPVPGRMSFPGLFLFWIVYFCIVCSDEAASDTFWCDDCIIRVGWLSRRHVLDVFFVWNYVFHAVGATNTLNAMLCLLWWDPFLRLFCCGEVCLLRPSMFLSNGCSEAAVLVTWDALTVRQNYCLWRFLVKHVFKSCCLDSIICWQRASCW